MSMCNVHARQLTMAMLGCCFCCFLLLVNHINSVTELYRALGKAKLRRCTITMPILDLQCSTDLSGILESTLDIPFDVSSADFAKMCAASRTRGLYLSQFVHNVRIKIDESGEKEVSRPSSERAILEEMFDYPFDLFVMNPDKDLIFFCGRIADPNPEIAFNPTLVSTEVGLRKEIREKEDAELEKASKPCLIQ